MPKLNCLSHVAVTALDLLLDALRFVRLSLQPRSALAAENLFVRKQLALYLDQHVQAALRASAESGITIIARAPRRAARSNPPQDSVENLRHSLVNASSFRNR